MEERIYLELQLQKSIQTDSNGNYIIRVEASNEDLDHDKQITLQRALLDSADYFLKNGIVSYDHRHLKADPGDSDWNPEKYIIGEPIDVEVQRKDGKTFVKALLYKSNAIVQEIIKKIKDGSTRIKASIGGKRPKVEKGFDSKSKRFLEKITSVQWDELAITFKPVNQTLSPVAFIKSLQAGYETDSAKITGGQALIPEDLEGVKRNKKNITAIIMALTFGDIKNLDEAKQFLKNRGYSVGEGDRILKKIIQKKAHIMEVLS